MKLNKRPEEGKTEMLSTFCKTKLRIKLFPPDPDPDPRYGGRGAADVDVSCHSSTEFPRLLPRFPWLRIF